MNSFLFSLVSTNAGWIGRQLLKYSTVAAAVITGMLSAKGLDATNAAAIGAGITACLLGAIEGTLSFIARKYATPELGAVNDAIEAAKKIIPAFIVMLCALCLMSCASVAAFIASPLGQTSIFTAEALGKQLANAAESKVIEQVILKAQAQITALNTEGVNKDTSKEIVRQSELLGLAAVITAAQQQYTGLTGHPYTLPKDPLAAVSLPVVSTTNPPTAAPANTSAN